MLPLTADKPKCMVEYRGKPLVDYLVETFQNAGIDQTIIINGYKSDVLENHFSSDEVTFRRNPDFETTNMVATLFCAEDDFDDDLIISYGDIIYKKNVLEELIASNAEISVVIDKDWESLWRLRMEDPLADAETLKLDAGGNIIELGKKPQSADEIQGQYIGLIKISKSAVAKVRNFYHGLDKSAIYDGKDYDNMFMTSFLQLIIDRLSPVKAVPINGGWIEIDSLEDLKAYESAGIDFNE